MLHMAGVVLTYQLGSKTDQVIVWLIISVWCHYKDHYSKNQEHMNTLLLITLEVKQHQEEGIL